MNWYDQLPAEMYGGTAKQVPKSSAIGNLPPTGFRLVLLDLEKAEV